MLKFVIPFVDVGDAVDKWQERCKPASGGNAAPAHNTAVRGAFTWRHGENGHVVAVLVVPTKETSQIIREKREAQEEYTLPVTAA